MSSSLDDYSEVAMQFGYNAMFAAALPISSCFALLANMLEVYIYHVDIYMCVSCVR